MIALDKANVMSRCEHRRTTCTSRWRRAASRRGGLERRRRLATEDSHEGGAMELYLREIGHLPVLTSQAERALASRAQRGDTAAREELLKCSLRLVVSIAQEHEGFGLSLFDLIAEGNLGLLKALRRFDPAKQEPLGRVAALRIRQAIQRALAKSARSDCPH